MIVSGLSMMKPLLHTPSTKGDLLKSSVAARMSGNGIRTCKSRKRFAAAIWHILPASCQHATMHQRRGRRGHAASARQKSVSTVQGMTSGYQAATKRPHHAQSIQHKSSCCPNCSGAAAPRDGVAHSASLSSWQGKQPSRLRTIALRLPPRQHTLSKVHSGAGPCAHSASSCLLVAYAILRSILTAGHGHARAALRNTEPMPEGPLPPDSVKAYVSLLSTARCAAGLSRGPVREHSLLPRHWTTTN